MSGSVRDPRVFDRDPLTGSVEYFHYDPDDDSFTIERQQDITGILELNKSLWNDAPLRHGDLVLVAVIPDVIVMELTKQGILAGPGKVLDEARFKAWLNDRDNRAFRARPGRV